MKTTSMQSYKKSESGNVLFLILIAVALFAALSYAVTQSSSSGGEGGEETALINSAQITQYPSSIRTAIIRMIIRGNDYQEFQFNPPALYSDCTAGNSNCVFHPDGGGATYSGAPNSVMKDDIKGTWHFNMEFEVKDVGTSVPGSLDGNEIIAFLPGITRILCERINEEFGISGDTLASGDMTTEIEKDMHHDYSLPSGEIILGDSSSSTDGLLAQPFGCFQNGSGGDYVYYHVLLEK